MRTFRIFPLAALFAAVFACISAPALNAQSLTLEGQTGGFITPTAYVVEAAKGHFFSPPAVAYSFINANKVIGDLHTFSIEEGFANRAEVGYTRSVHLLGDNQLFSSLWHYSGMNVFNGKGIAVRDGQGSPLTPGVAVGFVVRTGDRFVSGALEPYAGQPVKSYTNGDIYITATKTWAHKPIPFLANLGFKGTNASILGIGGQATRFQGRFFGGLGIPLPGPFHTAIVPAAGFLQQPAHSVNLGLLVPGGGHLPTTLDYAVRITQRKDPHFTFSVGVGQVAGMIGETEVETPTGTYVPVPVNLQARSVFGTSLGIRF